MTMSRPSTTLALEARGIGERRIADRRPQVGEQAEILAQAQQARLGPRVVGHRIPFRTADRAEDHGIGGLRQRHGGVGDGDLVGIVAGAADQPFLGLEGGEPARIHPGDELLDLGHDFGADAVAGEKQELVGRH